MLTASAGGVHPVRAAPLPETRLFCTETPEESPPIRIPVPQLPFTPLLAIAVPVAPLLRMPTAATESKGPLLMTLSLAPGSRTSAATDPEVTVEPDTVLWEPAMSITLVPVAAIGPLI